MFHKRAAIAAGTSACSSSHAGHPHISGMFQRKGARHPSARPEASSSPAHIQQHGHVALCSLLQMQQRQALTCRQPCRSIPSFQLLQPSLRCRQKQRLVASSSASAAAGGTEHDSQGSWLTRVVLPTALVLLVCNMDRICLSVAIVPMSQEYGWPASVQGLIQSAFLWGYTATQLLGGSLADKYGGKLVIAAGVTWFSLASLLLPAALSETVMAAGLALPAVLLARVCVGLGEGVALPSMNNLVAAHVPPSAKARALGMCFTGFHTGNLVGLVLSPLILLQFGWRALFFTFGLVGAPLLATWLAAAPEKPACPPGQAPAASSAAAQTEASKASMTKGADEAVGGSHSVSVWDLLSHPATWAIIIVNTVNHWGYFIYLNWMPSYFVKALGFDLRASSFLSLVPWLVMAVGSSASGFLADSLIAKGYTTTFVRKLLQSVSMLVPAVALLFLANPSIPPLAAVAAMTAALGTTSLGQAGFVANMSDIAPQQAGQMFGLCNTFGCLAGIAGVLAVGFIVEMTGSFTPVFMITAGLYIAAVLAWNVLCTGERVF